MASYGPSIHEHPIRDREERDEVIRERVADFGGVPPGPFGTVRAPLALSWGAILGGLFVALGVWVLMSTLGLAAGLSSIDPTNPVSVEHAGIGTGIWSLVVPLVSLLFGGIVAARTAGIVDRAAGAIHGAVLWALALVMSLVLIGAVVRGVATAALGLGSGAAAAAGQAGPDASRALGLEANDLLGPVNERLRAEGKPTVSAVELRAATADALRTAAREGRFDREMLVTALAARTRLSPDDARSLADQIEGRMNQEKGAVEVGAMRAADKTGKALWWVFLAMVLGLGASVVGSTIGVSRKQRIAADTVAPPLVPRAV